MYVKYICVVANVWSERERERERGGEENIYVHTFIFSHYIDIYI